LADHCTYSLTRSYFYPFHEERLVDCEISGEWLRATISERPRVTLPHGSYEGEWQAVTVLVRNPGRPPGPGAPTGTPIEPISPLDIPADDLPLPDRIGYSRRARGALVNVSSRFVQPEDLTFMVARPVAGGEVKRIDRHAKAFVARGTHNAYAEAGVNTAPKLDNALPLPIDLNDICDETNAVVGTTQDAIEVLEKVRFAKDKAKEIMTGLSKVLTGIGMFGPFGGLLFGFISALHEGVALTRRVYDPPDWPQGPDNVPDVGPPATTDGDAPNFGLVLAPAALHAVVQADMAARGERAVRLHAPLGPTAERVVDRGGLRQPWWQPDGQHPLGYRGRWGMMTERDPFDRRSGTRIPPFEAVFLNAVLRAGREEGMHE
jgi:hypothetical protein